MWQRRNARLGLLVIGVVLVAEACSGSSSSTTTSSPPPTTAAFDDAGCPSAPFSGSLSRSAAGGHTQVQRSGAQMVDSLAVVRRENVAYTIYLADYEIDREMLGTTLKAPAGSVLVTFAIDETDGIPIGIPFNNTENSSPFVIVDSGGGATNSAMGHSGEQTVIGLSADMLCFEIRYNDDVKAVSGTVSAPIVLP